MNPNPNMKSLNNKPMTTKEKKINKWENLGSNQHLAEVCEKEVKPNNSPMIHKQDSVSSNKKSDTQNKLSKYKEKRMEIDFWLTEYYSGCNELARLFMLKYFGKDADVPPDWVADQIGGVLIVNDYFFNMRDIIIALTKNVTRKKLFEWYDYYTEGNTKLKVNFNNYLKGVI